MNFTNEDCFIIERILGEAASELRASHKKSIALSTLVARNLSEVNSLCAEMRKQIEASKPEELVELIKKAELNDDDKSRKVTLETEFKKTVDEFIKQKSDPKFYTPKINLEDFEGVELSYDATSILDLILRSKDE